MPYLMLLESMLRWFESRGERGSHARYAASMAISVLIYMNIVTLTLFAFGLAGARWIDIFQSIPLNILAIFSLVALHSWLIGRIQQRGIRSNYAVSHAEPTLFAPAWLIYLVISVLLLFASTVIATR